ncbi:hypothetical protein ACFY1L_37290 [Streptomyces sp. NPDC001663]
MFQNAEEARKFISDVDVKFVDVRFCDDHRGATVVTRERRPPGRLRQ